MKRTLQKNAVRSPLFAGLSLGLAGTANAGPEDWQSPEAFLPNARRGAE